MPSSSVCWVDDAALQARYAGVLVRLHLHLKLKFSLLSRALGHWGAVYHVYFSLSPCLKVLGVCKQFIFVVPVVQTCFEKKEQSVCSLWQEYAGQLTDSEQCLNNR